MQHLNQIITKTTTQSDSNLTKVYADNKRRLLTQERKHKLSFVALILIRLLVKLNELSSTLLHNSYTWTFMKEAVAHGLIRRRPTGRPAKAYIFCGTGLGWHFEDRSPRETGLMWPARRLTRRGTGRNGMAKPVWHLYWWYRWSNQFS